MTNETATSAAREMLRQAAIDSGEWADIYFEGPWNQWALGAQVAVALAAQAEADAYRAGLEAAAKVAEADQPQSDNPGVVHGESIASYRIAAAIRALPIPKDPTA